MRILIEGTEQIRCSTCREHKPESEFPPSQWRIGSGKCLAAPAAPGWSAPDAHQ